MPLSRKRRAPANEANEASASEEENSRHRQHSPSSHPEAADGNTGSHAVGGPDEDGASSHQQMVKKLVRLALASEYARQPIRRGDVSVKVLGPHGRRFKQVFDGAQTELRRVFGMEMVELPMREKVTVSQRRAAQRLEKTATSSKAYILTSTLAKKYRSDNILAPPKVPTSETEATYVGLYTFIISLISLSGGSIGEAKLERYLGRTNADHYTPLDKTEKVLQRLCKEGYLVKIKDTGGGEEVIEYMVGPRGKVEVGAPGVADLVRSVYGDDVVEDLDARVERSLGLNEGGLKRKTRTTGEGGNDETRTPGRLRGRAAADDEDEEEEEEEEESDDG